MTPLIAQALYDTFHTARLSEHPEDAPEYERRAVNFVRWLGVHGLVVVPMTTADAKVELVARAIAAEIDAIDEELATCVNALSRDEWRKDASERIARAAITALEASSHMRTEATVEVMRDRLDRVDMLGEWVQKHWPDDENLGLIASDLRDCANGETIAACAEELFRLTAMQAARPIDQQEAILEALREARPYVTFMITDEHRKRANDVLAKIDAVLPKRSREGLCAFCDSGAVSAVSDDNDVFDVCADCEEAWRLNPGFTESAETPEPDPIAPVQDDER